MRLVTQPVARLCGRGRVIAQAIGLHDEAEVRPEEVDLEPVQACAGLWLPEASRAREGKELPLQLGVGEREGAAVEHPSQRRHTPAARVIAECGS
jgi:hypothetical protein